MSAQPEPPIGRTIPEGIVPRDPIPARLIVDAVDAWWLKLTPEQRVGLWVRYGPVGQAT